MANVRFDRLIEERKESNVISESMLISLLTNEFYNILFNSFSIESTKTRPENCAGKTEGFSMRTNGSVQNWQSGNRNH